MTETRTFAILPVSLKAYDEIRRAMILGERGDAIKGGGENELIDLDGIRVERRRWRRHTDKRNGKAKGRA